MAARAATLFDAAAEGRTVLVVEDVVLAEVVWTLRSFYQASRADIADLLRALLSDDNLLNNDKSALSLALTLYHRHNVGFADALIAARSLTLEDADVISFDRGISRIPGVVRHEPG